MMRTICAFGIETISWQSSIQEVINANAELKAAQKILESSDYQVLASSNGFLPRLSATAGYSYDSNLSKYYSASVTMTENLFSGFADTAKYQQSQYSQSSAVANLETVKAKISYDLKSAFMGLVYSQKTIKLASDIIFRREANLKLVQLRFENGRENIGSLHLSKAYLAQAKYDYLQATHSIEIYQLQLARVIGREDYSTLAVDGIVPAQSPPKGLYQFQNLKNLLADLPGVKKAFSHEQFSKAAIDLSHSVFYPTVDLTQSVGRNGRDSYSAKNTWTIGATVNFPLFNGGKDYYSHLSVIEDYHTSVFNRKNAEVDGAIKLKQAFTSFVEAQAKWEVDSAFLLAGNSRERIAKAQYSNGLISFSDWDAIENDLIIRQKNLLQTEKERVLAEASWEQAQGKGVIP
jgi:outer membrane protein TolC